MTSLRARAVNGTLNELQEMDIETLAWLEQHLNTSYIDVSSFFPNFQPLEETRFCELVPVAHWFARPNSVHSIHGISIMTPKN